jgi:hypothetical protein
MQDLQHRYSSTEETLTENETLHATAAELNTILSDERKTPESDLLRLQAVLAAKEGELGRMAERPDKMDAKQEAADKESRLEREGLRVEVQTLSNSVHTLQVENTNHVANIAEKDRTLKRLADQLAEAQSTLAALQVEVTALRAETALNREQCVAQTSMREQLQAQWEDLQKEHIATAAQLQCTVQMHAHSVELQKQAEKKAKVFDICPLVL